MINQENLFKNFTLKTLKTEFSLNADLNFLVKNQKSVEPFLRKTEKSDRCTDIKFKGRTLWGSQKTALMINIIHTQEIQFRVYTIH